MDPQSTPKVLIVEDEPLIALELATILNDIGCSVCAVVDSASEAIDAATRHAPDLILADICLQGDGDGITAVQTITAERKVPVLFVSGNWRELRSRGMGDALVIGKPFLPPILKQAIRNALKEGAH